MWIYGDCAYEKFMIIAPFVHGTLEGGRLHFSFREMGKNEGSNQFFELVAAIRHRHIAI